MTVILTEDIVIDPVKDVFSKFNDPFMEGALVLSTPQTNLVQKPLQTQTKGHPYV